MELQENLQTDQQKRGRMMLLAMAIFFAVPIVVVLLMMHFNWRPIGKIYGELLSPPRMISHAENLTTNDAKPAAKFWQDKWNMVYVAGDCQTACMGRLHDMRQLQVSMYKDMPRVQRVLLTTMPDVSAAKRDYPDMTVINQPQGDIAVLAKQFNIADEDALQSGRLYLVDPLGYIMMSYPATTKSAEIRKDLVRLLKSSWAG